jgi:hypothetical protein
MADPAGFLDEQVDRLGWPVGGTVGVEVREQLGLPGSQGPPESGDLGDRAGGQRVEQRLSLPATLGGCVGVVDRA